METKQQKIVKEISKEKIKDPSIVAMVVFGSVSVGEENENSDVDIQIISKKAEKYILNKKEKHYGIKIDLEIIPEKNYKKWIKDYPYLWYDYHKRYKIIFDKSGMVKKAMKYLKDYFKSHPEVINLWEEQLHIMKELKRKGIRQKDSCYRDFDEMEIKFSKEHKVTRDFYRN